MTAKEYLEQAKRLDIQINVDLRELDHWKEMSSRISGSSFEPHYNPNRNIEPPFVKCLDRISELEEKINDEVDRLVDLKGEIIDNIRRLDNLDHQNVLELRYIAGYSWEQIAAELNYSCRWVYSIHGRALQALEKILKRVQ